MAHERKNLLNHSRRGFAAVPVAAAAAGAVAVIGLALWLVERNQLRNLDANRAQTTAALAQAKAQIQDLTNRLNALAQSREQTADRVADTPARRPVPAAKRQARATNSDPRLDRLQGQLAQTRKELATTREDLATTRGDLAKAQEDLGGQISSTRDDLNGSIARTHDDVVALQKRGEQNIHEFKLDKSKQMQRVGPLSVSLRGTSTKHKTYDVVMMVEDNSLSKKHVNLYEPVWVTLGDRPQAVQLVVNRVGKNEVEGYVSEPKYKKSELAASSETPAKGPQKDLELQNR